MKQGASQGHHASGGHGTWWRSSSTCCLNLMCHACQSCCSACSVHVHAAKQQVAQPEHNRRLSTPCQECSLSGHIPKECLLYCLDFSLRATRVLGPCGRHQHLDGCRASLQHGRSWAGLVTGCLPACERLQLGLHHHGSLIWWMGCEAEVRPVPHPCTPGIPQVRRLAGDASPKQAIRGRCGMSHRTNSP